MHTTLLLLLLVPAFSFAVSHIFFTLLIAISNVFHNGVFQRNKYIQKCKIQIFSHQLQQNVSCPQPSCPQTGQITSQLNSLLNGLQSLNSTALSFQVSVLCARSSPRMPSWFPSIPFFSFLFRSAQEEQYQICCISPQFKKKSDRQLWCIIIRNCKNTIDRRQFRLEFLIYRPIAATKPVRPHRLLRPGQLPRLQAAQAVPLRPGIPGRELRAEYFSSFFFSILHKPNRSIAADATLQYTTLYCTSLLGH